MHTLCVPPQVFARDLCADIATVMVEHTLVMLDECRILFIKTWRWNDFARAPPVHDLTQQPRLAICAPANHQSISARLLKRLCRIINRADIAIHDDRDRNRVFHFPDEGPVGAALIHLIAGAAVDGNHLDAQVFCNAGHLGRVKALMVPAHAHFNGHWHIDRFHGRFHQLGRQRHLSHERRACKLSDDFANRAAEVDVDDRRAIALLQLGRFAHRTRITANELHRNRLFGLVPFRLLHRLARLANSCLTCDHLGHVKARAVSAHKRSERLVGDARHGSEDHGLVDRDGADLDRFQRRRCGNVGHRSNIGKGCAKMRGCA